MSKMHLWNAFMSLCGLGIGVVIFKLGVTPIMENHMFGLPDDEKVIYSIMAVAGLIAICQCASKFSDHFWGFIGECISKAWNRRKDRKRRQAMFANATPISAFGPEFSAPAPAPTHILPVAPLMGDQGRPAFAVTPPS